MSRAESAITLGPVGFELYGLLSIGQGLGVLIERSVGSGSVGVEDVVGRSEIDCFGEVAYGGGEVAGGERRVAFGFGFFSHESKRERESDERLEFW